MPARPRCWTVAAIITPWNAPLMLASWRIAPALAAGDTVVAKPPEWAPLTASNLADITAEAGLPDGVFNVVQGTGTDAGAPLTAHPGIDRLSFTGSVPTAGKVAAAAPHIVPLSLELGGDVPSYRADQMPYGGWKHSGRGREGVRSAMEDYTETKVLVLTGLDL